MSEELDWLSLFNYGGVAVPQSMRQYVSRSDEIFIRQDVDAAFDQFADLTSDLSWDLLKYIRFSQMARSAITRRELMYALQTDQPVEYCYQLLQKLMLLGFDSPVDKARIIIVVLNHLESKLSALELRPLIEAVKAELNTCRIGCEENLRVLETFVESLPGTADDVGS
jgi:hypothetical protein